MRIKRAPLVGGIVILIIFFLLITTNITKTEIPNSTVTIKSEEKISTQEVVDVAETPQPTLNVESEITTPPQTTVQPSINNTDLGSFKISAYCSCKTCCGIWSGGPTASGTMPEEGRTIAVDPNVIPLGSKVIIDGHTYIAEDTGGVIKGNRIDMYFNSHQDALNWGVQYKDVDIIN